MPLNCGPQKLLVAIAAQQPVAEAVRTLGGAHAVTITGGANGGSTVTFTGLSYSTAGNATPIGRALVAQLGENEFLVTAAYGKIGFTPASGAHCDYLRVEEGGYENGVFKPIRIWNGDETDYGGLSFYAAPQALRVMLGTY